MKFDYQDEHNKYIKYYKTEKNLDRAIERCNFQQENHLKFEEAGKGWTAIFNHPKCGYMFPFYDKGFMQM